MLYTYFIERRYCFVPLVLYVVWSGVSLVAMGNGDIVIVAVDMNYT